MSYIALARKWRPRTFSQLVGQEHITHALINSLTQNRLHHAYLFTGTRGVGKTSVARLLAKALNCEVGVTAEPCLQCDACLAIEQGRFIDLIEVDGASRTRVEDTRELLENVQYAPTSGRFKIYLLDEVHMLSTHSFNALLKTLEEPPEHVIFLLATTDPQKLPLTVLSRCLQFNLKHLDADVICQHLKHILDDEKFTYDTAAIELLAKAARGSMRDGLSLLDQAIASTANSLSTTTVKSILGYTQQDYALQLLRALANLEPQKMLALSNQITQEGGHFHYVIEQILSYLHQISVGQSIPNNNPLIAPEPEVLALSHELHPEEVQLFYQIGLKSIQDINLAPTLAIGFEMMLLRMYTFRPSSVVARPPLLYQTARDNAAQESFVTEPPIHIDPPQPSESHSSVAAHPSPLYQTQVENAAQESCVTEPPIHIDPPQPLESPLVDISEASPLLDITPPQPPLPEPTPTNESWSAILPKLRLSGLALNAAENAEWVGKEGGGVTLRVDSGHLSVFTSAVIKRIEEGLSHYYQENIKVALNTQEPVVSSPAQHKKSEQIKAQIDAQTALQNDPFFQQLQQEFSAELVKDSIVSLKDDL